MSQIEAIAFSVKRAHNPLSHKAIRPWLTRSKGDYEMARFIQAWKMYDLIPMKSKSILPDEGFDTRSLVIMEDDRNHSLTEMERAFPVYCLPKPNQGYAKHRVMVICDCGKHVPFGRMHQHWAKPTCTGVKAHG
jgi:hypothetical protein